MYPFKPRPGRRRSLEPFPRKRRAEPWGVAQTLMTIGAVSIGVLIGLNLPGIGALPALPGSITEAVPDWRDSTAGDSFTCRNPFVVDGDTLRCGNERVRLQGIDAPEKPGSCRPGRDCVAGDPFASTEHLRALTGRAPLTCTREDVDRYGRTIARCEAAGVDLSCAQIEAGHAVRRYGFIVCG
jgi:endonuclease YncB( thermonuclease family)